MALFVSLKDGVLVVRDEMPSFDQTVISWWYHDLENRMSSSGGQEGDEVDRPMDDDALAWITQHYLPLLKTRADIARDAPQQTHAYRESETAS